MRHALITVSSSGTGREPAGEMERHHGVPATRLLPRDVLRWITGRIMAPRS